MTANSPPDDTTLRRLQRQLAWSQGIAVLALLGVIALAIAWQTSTRNNRNGILRTHGIGTQVPSGLVPLEGPPPTGLSA